ncbi:reverse transcriptase domain-containing protein, partial [Tanacetum coccineum]
MLLMEAKEKGTILDAEAKVFHADVECTAPYDQPLAITTTNMFEVSHEDAYDSDVDEGPHAAAAFMANLSSTSGTNGATTSQVNEYQLDSEVQDVPTEEQSLVNDSLRAKPARCKQEMTTEVEAAFKQIKKLIAELPTLTALMEKEELIVYLAATREVVSAVLMTEREAKQMPIYFVSRTLQGPKINYTPVEKLVLALVHVSKRLKRPKVSIKGQILADFIVERPEDDSLAVPMEVEEELLESWTLFTDVSSCIDGSGAGLILTNPKGTEFTYSLRFEFNATNNEAEYEALIDGLGIAEQM